MPVDPQASVRISAFQWVPPFAQGHVRDLRARWALEEAGVPYAVRKLDAMAERPAVDGNSTSRPGEHIGTIDRSCASTRELAIPQALNGNCQMPLRLRAISTCATSCGISQA